MDFNYGQTPNNIVSETPFGHYGHGLCPKSKLLNIQYKNISTIYGHGYLRTKRGCVRKEAAIMPRNNCHSQRTRIYGQIHSLREGENVSEIHVSPLRRRMGLADMKSKAVPFLQTGFLVGGLPSSPTGKRGPLGCNALGGRTFKKVRT